MKNINLYTWILIILADIGIYFFLAISSLSFEDIYNSSFSEYFKSPRLSIAEKMIPVIFYAWFYLNIAAALFLLFKWTKRLFFNAF